MNDHFKLLKLKAVDYVDIQIVAGALQDAIVPTLDIAYDENLKQFMFASNRIRWENKNKTGKELQSTQSGVLQSYLIAGVISLVALIIIIQQLG